jgi:hypothetical protein
MGIILQQFFFISEKRNDHENFIILKREIIHSSLSPLYVQKVAMKFILFCRGHANDDSCKK